MEADHLFSPGGSEWGRMIELTVCTEHDDVLRHGDASWEYDDNDHVIRMGDDAFPKLGHWEIERSAGYTVIRLTLDGHAGERSTVAFRIDPDDARALGGWLAASRQDDGGNSPEAER